MSTKLVEKGNATYEVTTSIKGEKWANAQEKAVNKLVKNVQIKGFRKGKAPLNLAKERLDQTKVFNEAVDSVLQEMYIEVIKEHNLKPFMNSGVVINKISSEELEVTFKIINFPEVTLGEYKNLGIKLKEASVSEEEINKELENSRLNNAEWSLKEEGSAEMGDMIVMDFKGYVDGKEFDGGSANNYSLELGSNQFIPGFEQQLVGAKPESKIDVNVTFPEQYVKELAGKDAKFVCMVHEIKTKNYPELNDEFVKGLSIKDVDNLESYKKYLENNLKETKLNQAKAEQYNQILDTIIKNSKFTYAPEVIDEETASIKKSMLQQINQNGLTYEQYKEITGLSDEEITNQFKKEAENRVLRVTVLDKIAAEEKLMVTEEDINEYFNKIATQYKMDVEEVKKYFNTQLNSLKDNLLQNKIENFLIENNK
ncbi:MAG: trigger factor [Bacillales bacterium]